MEENGIQKYIEEKKELYNNILNFLESPNSDDDLTKIIEKIKNGNIERNQEELRYFLKLIINISNNHHRSENLINKIEQIILNFQEYIKQTFSNVEIFELFKSNKMILQFLFENKIIKIDNEIYEKMTEIKEKNGFQYIHFFYNDIKEFIENENIKTIENELLAIDSNIFYNFDIRCHQGENDSYLCCLIRHDWIEEFIEYVNKTNTSLFGEIKPSLFETNPFLIKNSTTIIEYSAFFGSIRIFNYLRANGVALTSSLWLLAIHSNNAELIQILENEKIEPIDKNYEKCMRESIKCHHNDMANYFLVNYLNMKENNAFLNDDIVSSIYKYFNYSFFTSIFNKNIEFFYLRYYNYDNFIDIILEEKRTEIQNITQIKNNNFFSFNFKFLILNRVFKF